MVRRLAEKLVVPEPHRPIQQLRRRHQKRRTPEHVVKCRPRPPRPQGVKQNRVRIAGFVRVVFVKQPVRADAMAPSAPPTPRKASPPGASFEHRTPARNPSRWNPATCSSLRRYRCQSSAFAGCGPSAPIGASTSEKSRTNESCTIVRHRRREIGPLPCPSRISTSRDAPMTNKPPCPNRIGHAGIRASRMPAPAPFISEPRSGRIDSCYWRCRESCMASPALP